MLIKLAEEATEVAQIALKASQFGLEDIKPEQEYSNKDRVHQELNDLNGIIKMLNDNFNFNYTINESAVLKKTTKVSHYLEYSKILGQVQ